MLVRMYAQVVELGDWQACGDYDTRWCVKETIEDAKEVNKFREEAKKEDVNFAFGVFISPRYGKFHIAYKFVEEVEKNS